MLTATMMEDIIQEKQNVNTLGGDKMEFRDLDLQKLRCNNCGNEEDFVIDYNGSVLVHAYKDDTPDWEEPHEEISLITCHSCGKTYLPALFEV